MSNPKLSFSTTTIARIGKHSANRVSWVTAKKTAAKHIDPDAAFKKVKGELGAELDKLRDLVEGAKKFIKAYPQGLDAAGKKLVSDQAERCKTLIRAYQKACDAAKAKPGLSPAKVDAWKTLHMALAGLESHVDAGTRPVLR